MDRQPLSYYLALRYPITFTPCEEGGFFVEIVDLPGCYSQGETLYEAYQMIENARHLWLTVAYDCGVKIPEPTGLRV